MKYIDLPIPHGFLIWRGKQTAIAMPEPIPADQLLIVSNGEAFGEAMLSKPIAVNVKEFNRHLEKHCIKELERKLWWPESDALFIHEIREFKGFEEPVLFENGEMVDYRPTEQEQALIDQATELPKQIPIDDSAVIICGDGQHYISDIVKGFGDIARILEAGIKVDGSDNVLPIYSLALVRNPRLVVKKKEYDEIVELITNEAEATVPTEDKQEEGEGMPYRIMEDGFGECEQIAVVKTETEELAPGGCHETMEEAQAHLAALNMAMEDESLHDEEEKQNGDELLQAKLDNIRAAFESQFNYDHDYSSWLIDATDTYIIAEVGGNKYRIPYQESENGMMFASREMWSEVKVTYADKAKDDKQFDESEWSGSASNWDTADAYCSDCLIDLNPAGAEKTKALCKLPYRKPGSQNPNKNALQAMASGARGLSALTKPADVSAEVWSSKVKSAANKLIGWWPDAFDKPAPDSIYSAAGKTPPASANREATGWATRIKEAVSTMKEFLSWAKSPDLPDYGIAQKEVDGEPWHFMWSTNAFEDREKEIFSTKALDNFANEVNQKENKGYFNFWHIATEDNPGLTDFAEKRFVETVGRFLIEAGPYLKDEKGQAALKFFKQYKDGHPDYAPEGWGGSPEFRFNLEDRADGVYDWLWIDRTSTLPRAAAANLYTQSSQQEVKMSTLEGQRKDAAIALFGEGFIEELLNEGEKRTTTLEQAGVAHKENAEEKPEEKPADIEAIVEAAVRKVLTEKVDVDLSTVTEVVKGLGEKLNAQAAELETLKKQKQIEQETETPRYVLSLQKRASGAQETAVADDDELKGKKPAETPTGDKSLAGQFFGR